jgi:hypothetical protein
LWGWVEFASLGTAAQMGPLYRPSDSECGARRETCSFEDYTRIELALTRHGYRAVLPVGASSVLTNVRPPLPVANVFRYLQDTGIIS